MRKSRTLLFIAVGVTSTLFGAAAARAQTASSVTGIDGTALRCEPPVGAPCDSTDNADDPDGGTPHPLGVLDDVIDTEDCDADLHYQFSLGISAPSPTYTLEVWAGTEDCSQLVNRTDTATAVCWPVISPAVALTNPTVVGVRVEDVVSGAFTTTHPVTYTASSSGVCQSLSLLDAGFSGVTVYFFFVDGAGNPVGTVQQYPVTLSSVASAAAPAGSDRASNTGEGDLLAPSGGACAIGPRGPAGGAGFVGVGVAGIAVGALRRRKAKRRSRA